MLSPCLPWVKVWPHIEQGIRRWWHQNVVFLSAHGYKRGSLHVVYILQQLAYNKFESSGFRIIKIQLFRMQSVNKAMFWVVPSLIRLCNTTGVDQVVSELCYEETILQRNDRKIYHFMAIHGHFPIFPL